MMPSVIDFSRLIKVIGTVSFIRLLLVMAGVEPNPGPTDQFIFRYQYLLIEIGTKVLRSLLDHLVNNDLMVYLNANPKQYNQLQFLMRKAGVITTVQKQYLPPIDMNPKSSNFDITLLVCLLRNVCDACGLRRWDDTVWKVSPVPGDFSIEADIVRLKECRNNLAHSDTVFISEMEFNKKWIELTDILLRLNQKCGISGPPNLTLSLNEAEQMCMDENLKARYDQEITDWVAMEKSFEQGIEELKVVLSKVQDDLSEVKVDQSVVKDGLSEVKQNQSEAKDDISEVKTDLSEVKDCLSEVNQNQFEVKDDISEVKTDLSKVRDDLAELKLKSESHAAMKMRSDAFESKENQKYQRQRLDINEKVSECKHKLIDIYKEECRTLPVAPLCADDEDEVDLMTFYMSPELKRIPYHREQKESESVHQEQKKPTSIKVSFYEELFYHEDKMFMNIFITGDAGVGKTSFCRRMSLLWSESQTGKKVDDLDLQKDIDFMKRFNFVFYVSLRETDHEDVVDMIIDQFFYTNSVENREIMYRCIETIMKDFECLIILDALDEWTPKRCGTKACALPKKIRSERCKYLTTCRPYKIEQIRPSRKDLDCQVKMTGITEYEAYVRKIVSHINKVNRENKNPDDFFGETKKCGLGVLLNIPILADQLILMWFDKRLTEMPRAQIYSNILEMLFERAEQRNILCPSSTDTEFQLPTFFSDLIFFRKHISLIEKLCLLAFRSLFKQDQCVTLLVFTKHQLLQAPYFISTEDADFLCKIGILSRNKVVGRFGKGEQKLSFLHKSYIEFLAALFVTSFDENNLFDAVVEEWNTVSDVRQFELFLLFLTGLSCKKVASVFESIYPQISNSLKTFRRNANYPFGAFRMILHNQTYFNQEELYSTEQIQSLQMTVLNCFKEVSRSDVFCTFKLEDYIFHNYYSIPLLKQLCSINQTCVKFLYSVQGEYFDEFDRIKHLEHLLIGRIQVNHYQKFEQMILQNQSTLITLCIDGYRPMDLLDPDSFMIHSDVTVIQEVPVRSIHHLTSLTLCSIKLHYHNYATLIFFLNEKVLIENIKLIEVSCFFSYEDHPLNLRLKEHTKLNSLCLNQVDVLCPGVNNSSLKSILLHPLISPLMGLSMSYYVDVFESVKNSQLEHIIIDGCLLIEVEIMTKLLSTLKSLPYIKSLTLINACIPDDILFQLHPGVTHVEIKLRQINMTENRFTPS